MRLKGLTPHQEDEEASTGTFTAVDGVDPSLLRRGGRGPVSALAAPPDAVWPKAPILPSLSR